MGFPDVKTLSEKKLRQSIFTLVQVLTKDNRKFEYQKATEHEDGLSNDFPFESFRYVIQDYLNRGYVKESGIVQSHFMEVDETIGAGLSTNGNHLD